MILVAWHETAAGLELARFQKVMGLIEAFETDARNKLVENVGHQSPSPRILPLRDLLRARR